MNKRIAALLLAALLPAVSQAWIELGTHYEAATVHTRLGDICDSTRFPLTPGTCTGDAANPDWSAEVQTAFDRWHAETSTFLFTSDPGTGVTTPGDCDSSDPNSTYFLDTICGTAFGGSTLAVANTFFLPGVVSVHSDVIFNTAFIWGAYDDAGSNHPGVIDFRRVAVHEFGHVAGLGHPFHESAIMAPIIQNLINAPQPDDVAGMNAVNGGSFSVAVDDVNGNGSQEILHVRRTSTAQVVAEIRDSSTEEVLYLDNFFESGFHAVDAVLLGDEDASGFRDLAILAIRESDLRPLVRIRNIGGAENTRKVKFSTGPFGSGVAPMFLRDLGDADGDGFADLAVFGVRAIDLRSYVEIRNSDEEQGASRLILMGQFTTPVDVEIITGVGMPPRLAVLMLDWLTGGGYLELRNGFGDQERTRVNLRTQADPIDMAIYQEAGDTKIAYLSQRFSNGQGQIELRSTTGQPGSIVGRLDPRYLPLGITTSGDQDGDGLVDFTVVARRSTDGRITVAAANTDFSNLRVFVMVGGFDSASSYFTLDDSDADGFGEIAVQLSRQSDARVAVHYANIAGPPLSRTMTKVMFTP